MTIDDSLEHPWIKVCSSSLCLHLYRLNIQWSGKKLKNFMWNFTSDNQRPTENLTLFIPIFWFLSSNSCSFFRPVPFYLFRSLRGGTYARRTEITRLSAGAWRLLVSRSIPSSPTPACLRTTPTPTLSASPRCSRRLRRLRKAWRSWSATSALAARTWQRCYQYMRRRRGGTRKRTRASLATWTTSAKSCSARRRSARSARRTRGSLCSRPTSSSASSGAWRTATRSWPSRWPPRSAGWRSWWSQYRQRRTASALAARRERRWHPAVRVSSSSFPLACRLCSCTTQRSLRGSVVIISYAAAVAHQKGKK